MAIPRFRPGHIWTNDEWANLPIRGSELAAKLCAAGFTVLGVTNKKPELQEKINNSELQQLVMKLLRNEASSTPSPIIPAEEVPRPSKKKSRR